MPTAGSGRGGGSQVPLAGSSAGRSPAGRRGRPTVSRTRSSVSSPSVAVLAPDRTLSRAERGDDAAARFLAARGFHRTRSNQAWSVDPRTVVLDDLPGRVAAAEAAGLRVVPIRRLLDRPADLYRLHRLLQRDLPSDEPIAQSYAVCRVHELDTPLLEPDASFCVLAGDDPITLTWINLDLAGHRASHGMTGTRHDYRHRGLAWLVKLASIRWLAPHAVTALYTDSDTENRDMLALNEHLGFRPLTVFDRWAREA